MERATISPTDTPSAAGFDAAGDSPHVTRGPLKFLYSGGARPLAGYTIKRGIGRGGFGEVYYAESDGGKEVALKLIRRHLDVELRGIAHCLNLKHPNLLALYDVKQDGEENTWVVMEYISGQSLEQVLAAHPQGLPPSEACAWVRGIAAGAAYLHNHGIVHRDLKPGNVFRDEGIVKLGDYGLSKFISCSRRSGNTDSVGTVHYMAPEVANGRYGKQIDIYALGIILYEMLTGRVPFEGESIGEVLMKHLTALPDVSMLPEPYRAIVARALAKDPEQRFESIEEMTAALPGGLGAAGATFVPAPPAAPLEATPVRTAGEPNPTAAQAATAAKAVAEGGSALDRDPLVRMVRKGCRHLGERLQRSTGHRLAAVLIGLFVLASVTSAVEQYGGTLAPKVLWRLFSWTVLAALAYAVYRATTRGRTKTGHSAEIQPGGLTPGASAAPTAQPAGEAFRAGAEAGNSPLGRRRRWRDQAAVPLPSKPPRQLLTELVGSLLLSAAGSLVISLLVLLCRGQLSEPQQYAWLATVSTLGAWSVLVPAKLWEGKRGDAALRRFAMLVVGLGVGWAAFGFEKLLLVDLPVDKAFAERLVNKGPDLLHTTRTLYAEDGSPLAGAFLVYFGLLFLAVRWWRLADPQRTARLSLWATARTLLAAFVINLFWPFPQPWGLMVTAAVALSVQLAAPLSGVGRVEPRG